MAKRLVKLDYTAASIRDISSVSAHSMLEELHNKSKATEDMQLDAEYIVHASHVHKEVKVKEAVHEERMDMQRVVSDEAMDVEKAAKKYLTTDATEIVAVAENPANNM